MVTQSIKITKKFKMWMWYREKREDRLYEEKVIGRKWYPKKFKQGEKREDRLYGEKVIGKKWYLVDMRIGSR